MLNKKLRCSEKWREGKGVTKKIGVFRTGRVGQEQRKRREAGDFISS